MNVICIDEETTVCAKEFFALIVKRKLFISDLVDLTKQLNMKNQTFYICEFDNSNNPIGMIFIDKDDINNYDEIISQNDIILDWDKPDMWSSDMLEKFDKLLSSKYKNMLVQTIRIQNPKLFNENVKNGLFNFIYTHGKTE